MEQSSRSAFEDVCSESMQSARNRSPCELQRKVAAHIVSMQCYDNDPYETLLAQGTGGGKSAVHESVGTVGAGLALVVENALSLGADQHSKMAAASGANGPVESFQLDSLKSKASRRNLNQCLRSLRKDTNGSIFLLAPPEELLKFPWLSLMLHLAN